MEITASGPIRAKYFIKSKLTHHNHGPLYEMGPVLAEGDDGTENEGYFQASPFGECTVRFERDKDMGLEVGAFYYFTFTPIEEAPEEGHWWELDSRCETSHQIDFKLTPRGRERPYSFNTAFEVGVDPDHTTADFGKPGGMFDLRIEKAP